MGNVVFGEAVAATYRTHLESMLFEDYADDLCARLRVPASGAVLETACGTGVVTRRLRTVLDPSVRLVATDLNSAMLAHAREGLEGVEFAVADATSLSYPDETFDAVVCQYGAMFFPDRVVAYREARRVLRPGGAFVFNVWDSLEQNPVALCVHEAVQLALPEDPPMFLEKPYFYHDLTLITREMQEAGFGRLEITVLPQELRAPSAGFAAVALGEGTPLGQQLAERGAGDRHKQIIEDAVRARFGDGEIRAPMQAFVIVAER